jgi:hypothetical protein
MSGIGGGGIVRRCHRFLVHRFWRTGWWRCRSATGGC